MVADGTRVAYASTPRSPALSRPLGHARLRLSHPRSRIGHPCSRPSHPHSRGHHSPSAPRPLSPPAPLSACTTATQSSRAAVRLHHGHSVRPRHRLPTPLNAPSHAAPLPVCTTSTPAPQSVRTTVPPYRCPPAPRPLSPPAPQPAAPRSLSPSQSRSPPKSRPSQYQIKNQTDCSLSRDQTLTSDF